MTDHSRPYLEIRNLSAAIKGRNGRILRDVSLSLRPSNVHGLVGESGAGKSLIGKAIIGVLPRVVEILEGQIRLDGHDVLSMPASQKRKLVGEKTAVIPQDPLTALNPSRRVGVQITDRLTRILGWSRQKANRRALEVLQEVHIHEPERVFRSYPHELSGGMRQRTLIAAAFAAEPRLIIADEPTTALDVTVQKQILRLIAELQSRHQTALLFVTHDMGVVAKICQDVSVLYAGKIVEQTTVQNLFENPRHAYTRALIDATPRYDQPEQSLLPISRQVSEQLVEEIRRTDAEWEQRSHG